MVRRDFSRAVPDLPDGGRRGEGPMARIERVGGLRRLWCRFTTKNKQPLCGCRDDYRMVDGRGGWGLATRGIAGLPAAYRFLGRRLQPSRYRQVVRRQGREEPTPWEATFSSAPSPILRPRKQRAPLPGWKRPRQGSGSSVAVHQIYVSCCRAVTDCQISGGKLNQADSTTNSASELGGGESG